MKPHLTYRLKVKQARKIPSLNYTIKCLQILEVKLDNELVKIAICVANYTDHQEVTLIHEHSWMLWELVNE